MAEKKVIIYRCPVCFARENDVVIRKYDGIYRCVKCSFFGSEEQIQAMYADLRQKYTLRTKRITMEDMENM
jgi:ribosomal protein L37AE/L43A